MYWLQFSDFYDWEHITTFDSSEDLLNKLKEADFEKISRDMQRSYKRRRYVTLREWCDIIPKVKKHKEGSTKP